MQGHSSGKFRLVDWTVRRSVVCFDRIWAFTQHAADLNVELARFAFVPEPALPRLGAVGNTG